MTMSDGSLISALAELKVVNEGETHQLHSSFLDKGKNNYAESIDEENLETPQSVEGSQETDSWEGGTGSLGKFSDLEKEECRDADRDKKKASMGTAELQLEKDDPLKLQWKLESLDYELKAAKAKLKLREKELQEKDSAIISLKQEMKVAGDKGGNYLESAPECKEENEGLKSKLAQKTEEVDKLKTLLSSTSVELINIQGKVKEMQDNWKDVARRQESILMDEINALKQENRNQLDRITELEEQLKLENEKLMKLNSIMEQKKSLKCESEIEGDMQMICYEAKKEQSRAAEFIKNSFTISDMTADEIRSTISDKQRMNQTLDNLDNLDTKIQKLIIEYSVKAKLMTTAQIQKCKDEMKTCKETAEKICLTFKKIEQEAKDRMIRLSSHERGEKRMPVEVNKPSFNGESGILHFYEFVKISESYFKHNEICREEQGATLKSFCHGLPRQILENRFRLEINPNLNEVLEVLKEMFGNKKKILKDIIVQQETIGKIILGDNRTSKINAKKVFDIAEKHLAQWQKVTLLREPEYDEEGTILDSKLNIDDYLICIRNILPDGLFDSFVEKIRNKTDESRMKIVESYLNGIRRNASEVLAADIPDIETEEGKQEKRETQTKIVQGNTFSTQVNLTDSWSEEIEIENCPLCRYLKQNFNMEASNKIHGMSQRNGRVHCLIDTCPHVVHLSVEEKNNFFKAYNYCRICSLNPVNPSHHESHCKFTENNPRRRCRDQQCSLRAELCPQHLWMNKRKLSQRREHLEKIGIDFNY